MVVQTQTASVLRYRIIFKFSSRCSSSERWKRGYLGLSVHNQPISVYGAKAVKIFQRGLRLIQSQPTVGARRKHNKYFPGRDAQAARCYPFDIIFLLSVLSMWNIRLNSDANVLKVLKNCASQIPSKPYLGATLRISHYPTADRRPMTRYLHLYSVTFGALRSSAKTPLRGMAAVEWRPRTN